mmetsp:Transcript_18732/g.27897  ORF Transcript_18732/g.27897 Transcript_18732/m.27897 type:complete len:425 (+) Transcript_18732:42-1316(+)
MFLVAAAKTTTKQLVVSRSFFSTGVEICCDLEIHDPARDSKPRKAYSLLDENGLLRQGVKRDQLDIEKEEALSIYDEMVSMREMDKIGYEVQRQGRISFYMTHFGEEAEIIGASYGLNSDDTLYCQYREAGLLLRRGWTFDTFFNQLYSNTHDLGKGRQMPVHYGSAAAKLQTISSPLTTQLPQAAGAGYALKQQHQASSDPDAPLSSIVACFFGEGAASEGDFHAGVNFAATVQSPVLFFCRNNGYAISTPIKDQFRGDGIVSRAPGYGIKSLRVDGNDALAVRAAVKAARQVITTESTPFLLETMSYRVGHHSTSDDSTSYRSAEEIALWEQTNNPLSRFRKFLINEKWWSEEEDKQLERTKRKEITQALKNAEKQKKPPIEQLFTDVYDQLTPNLQKQQQELFDHLENYGDHYRLDHYEKS